jgi:hypothetical protein
LFKNKKRNKPIKNIMGVKNIKLKEKSDNGE